MGRVTPRRLAVLAVAVLVMASETPLLVNAAEIRGEESFDRCAADRAVVLIEASVARGQGYPADLHEIALADDGYGKGRCYVSNGVNWLYRVSAPGTYTLGYWVDYHLSRRVCLHRARAAEWECGFEMWGPFRPGEID